MCKLICFSALRSFVFLHTSGVVYFPHMLYEQDKEVIRFPSLTNVEMHLFFVFNSLNIIEPWTFKDQCCFSKLNVTVCNFVAEVIQYLRSEIILVLLA